MGTARLAFSRPNVKQKTSNEAGGWSLPAILATELEPWTPESSRPTESGVPFILHMKGTAVLCSNISPLCNPRVFEVLCTPPCMGKDHGSTHQRFPLKSPSRSLPARPNKFFADSQVLNVLPWFLQLWKFSNASFYILRYQAGNCSTERESKSPFFSVVNTFPSPLRGWTRSRSVLVGILSIFHRI